MDEFHQFLLDSDGIRDATVPVKMMPGDAVLWRDDEVLHGRNSFSAKETSERFLWKCAIEPGIVS